MRLKTTTFRSINAIQMTEPKPVTALLSGICSKPSRHNQAGGFTVNPLLGLSILIDAFLNVAKQEFQERC